MSIDLTEAKTLIGASLSADEQAEFYAQQSRQHAHALLGHVANVERLEAESALLPAGEAKDQLAAAIVEQAASVDVLVRSVSESKVKVDAFAAAKAAKEPAPTK